MSCETLTRGKKIIALRKMPLQPFRQIVAVENFSQSKNSHVNAFLSLLCIRTIHSSLFHLCLELLFIAKHLNKNTVELKQSEFGKLYILVEKCGGGGCRRLCIKIGNRASGLQAM